MWPAASCLEPGGGSLRASLLEPSHGRQRRPGRGPAAGEERQRSFQRRLVRLEPQFVPLLFSVLLPVVLLPVAALPDGRFHWLLAVLLTFQVVQSLRALPALGPGRLAQLTMALQRLLGFGAVAGMWTLALVAHHGDYRLLRFAVLLLSGLFSLVASLKLVLLLARVPRVNARVMAGAAAGYIYLGLTGGLVAAALQLIIPGTFTLGISRGHELLVDRLTYFSFVVLAGLGLGDAAPQPARRAVRDPAQPFGHPVSGPADGSADRPFHRHPGGGAGVRCPRR